MSLSEYIEKVLEIFRMKDAKPINTPLDSHFKLTKEIFRKTQEEIDYMTKVPYSSIFDNLIYAMVFTRPDISHVVGVVRRYMKNLGKKHWMEEKWILRYLRGTTA